MGIMQKKILIVDDEPDIVTLLEVRFKFIVFKAYDGEAALKIIYKEKPDLIFLDFKLPKLNGYEVLKIVKKDKDFKNVPIIIFTAYSKSELTKGISKEADLIVTKPFDYQELLKEINRFLK
jgi:two-component system alkaline phosphatase synthesis response regulator PhoP